MFFASVTANRPPGVSPYTSASRNVIPASQIVGVEISVPAATLAAFGSTPGVNNIEKDGIKILGQVLLIDFDAIRVEKIIVVHNQEPFGGYLLNQPVGCWDTTLTVPINTDQMLRRLDRLTGNASYEFG